MGAIDAHRAKLEVIAGGGDPLPPPDADRSALLAELSARLGVDHIGAIVTDAQVFGVGPTARVRITLSTGQKITFERFSHVGNGAQLGAHVVTYCGVIRSFKNQDAAAVASLVYRLSCSAEEDSEEAMARAWGVEYLSAAPTLPAALDDQAKRWRVFSELHRMNPAADVGDRRDAQTFAEHTIVLHDEKTGRRLVRAGWMQQYIARRQDAGGYGPVAIGGLLLAVGWTRNGKTGRIKASQPAGHGQLVWPFFVIAPNWEQEDASCE